MHNQRALLAALVLLAARADADPMLTPRENGTRLVEAVVERIDATCVFPDDKLLGRRIAFVESRDGTAFHTFRDGYHGGIWQLDAGMFNETKSINNTQINNQRNAIRTVFGLNWTSVTWQDLTTPLHSALAARLFIHSRGAVIPRDVEGQATFYVTHYRRGGDPYDFRDAMYDLEKQSGCRNSNGADIVFVVDGSGSIGAANFVLIKNFIRSAVDVFDVGLGPTQTRIGLIQFATDVFHEFYLTTYTNKTQLLAVINNLPYRGGGTNTHLALDAMRTVSYTEARGARPLDNGHPRVGIVITDGQSANPTLTAQAAKRAHDADISLISVGVGGAVDTELRAIASDPVCLNVIMLTGFNEFQSLKDIIEKRTCDAPIIISITQGAESSLAPGRDINCKIKIPTSSAALLASNGTVEKGLTLRVWTTNGSATFYLSATTYPNAYFHDQLVRSVPGEPGVIYIESGNAEGVLYANVEGSATETTVFKLEAGAGDSDYCKTAWCPADQRCVDTGKSYTCKENNSGSFIRANARLGLLFLALSCSLMLLR
jgi:hypothetical protein